MSKPGHAILGYVRARERTTQYPLVSKSGIRIFFNRLPVTSEPTTCNHTETICITRECIESWGLGDWQLFLEENKIGKQIINDLRLTFEDVSILMEEDFIFRKHLPSRKEAS